MFKEFLSIFFTLTIESIPATQSEQDDEVSYNLSFNGYQLTTSSILAGSI